MHSRYNFAELYPARFRWKFTSCQCFF